MANTIEIKLGLKGASEVTAGLKQVQQSVSSAFGALKTLALPLAGAAGLAGITAGLKDVIELGGKLKDMSAATGVGAAKLMVYSTALRDAGVNADNMGTIFAHMGKALEDAFDGTGPGAKGLSKVGLDINDLINKDPATQFESIAAAIGKLATPSERAAAAMDIFGKSGAELVPFFRDGGALSDAAKTLGALPEVMQRNKETLDSIGDSFGHLKIKSQQLFAGFLDLTAPILKSITDLIDGIDLTPIGQKIGAMVVLAKVRWSEGKFGDFIGLTIRAGFESIGDLFKGGTISRQLVDGIVTLSNEAVRGTGKLVVTVLEYMGLAFVNLAESFGRFTSGIINSVASSLESVINKALAGLQKLTGVQMGGVQLGRTHLDASTYEAHRKSVEDMANAAKGKLDSVMDSSTAGWRNALGTGGDDTKPLSAKVELQRQINELMEQQKKLTAGAKKDGDDANKTLRERVDWMGKERFISGEIQAINQQLREVENNFAMTEVEKYGRKRQLLEAEIALQKDKLDLLMAQAAVESDPNKQQALLNRADAQRNALMNSQGQLSIMGADPESFSQQWQKAFKEVKNEWKTVAQNVAEVGKTAMQSLTRTMGNALDDMIWRTGSLKDLWKSFAHTLTSSVTQALSNMFAQWIAGIIAKRGAETAAATAETAAKTPGALMDSISSFGIAAAVGAAALLAAMAAFGGFREHGGPVSAGTAYVVGERRPELFVPSTSGVILPRVDMGTAASVTPSASTAAAPEVHVHFVSDPVEAMKAAAKDPSVQHVIVDGLRRRRLDIGVQS